MDGLKRWDGLVWPVARQVGLFLRTGPLSAGVLEPHGLILRPGGMGDLICAQMALEALGLDPREPLWLINRRSEAWAEAQRLRFFCLEDGMIRLLRSYRGKVKLVINTEQYFGLAHAFALALGGEKLVAFASNRAAGPETSKVTYDPYEEHEVSSHARLFQQAYGLPSRDVLPQRLRQAGGQEKIVCVSGRQSPSRALPLQTWEHLLKGWSNGAVLTLTGAPVDREFTQELARRTGAVIFSGSFVELLKKIAQAGEVFTLDSGMVHVASYYGIPTTAVFTSGREKKWAPLAPGSRLVRLKDLACQPCTLFGQVPPCPNAYACQKLSWPENVRAVT